ncbi:MAG: hypothetical protein ACTSRH_06765 [Promethearchaeota archaeon]
MEERYPLYRTIYSFIYCNVYFFHERYGKEGIFTDNKPYIYQINKIEEKNIRYAIFSTTSYGLSKIEKDFLNNFLITNFYNKKLYSYQNLTIYYAQNLNYNFPQSKNYSGTFSFEKDLVGSIPEQWTASINTKTNYVKIINDFYGHSKVMQIFDNSSDNFTEISQNFNRTLSNGTIEFWVFHNNPYQPVMFTLMNQNQIKGPTLYLGKDSWKYFNGVSYQELLNMSIPSIFRWHHVRIDFECNFNNYSRLKKNEFRITIDGISSNELKFNENCNDVSLFKIKTNVIQNNYKFLYIDAIGYSWDPNYTIGDNLI